MSYEALIRSARKTPLFTKSDSVQAVEFGRREIERLIPHRAPFLLVDGISAVDLSARTILGRRRIDPSDPIFAGHFPGDPVYPGVLLLETMAQLSICLQHFVSRGATEIPKREMPLRLRLLRIHHALYQAEVRPGDELTVAAKMVEDSSYTAILAGQIIRGSTICTVGILEAYLLDDESRASE